MDKQRKYKKLIIALIIAIVVVLAATTYALWTITKKQTTRNLVGTACLNINFTENGPDINIEDMYPTADNDTEDLPSYTFTLENTCNEAVNYMVVLESVADSSATTGYVADSYIKLSLSTNDVVSGPFIYNNLSPQDNAQNPGYTIRNTKKIMTKRLGAHKTNVHTLKMWLDENTPDTESNKHFFSKIRIIAGQGVNHECYTVNNEGYITAYDPDCGKSVTIPAKVGNKNVVGISADAFKTQAKTYTYTTGNGYSTYSTLAEFDSYLASNSCYTEDGTAPCQKDFGIAFSEKLSGLLSESEPDPTATSDDIWVVIYTDSDDPRYEEALTISESTLEDLADLLSELGIDLDDVETYIVGEGTVPESDGEVYYALNYINGEWGFTDPAGFKAPSGVQTVLSIDSLDLSKATNLQTIEARAFSTLPPIEEAKDICEEEHIGLDNIVDRARVGLTSLTFGNNKNTIKVGGGAFAKSVLSDLTLYNSLEFIPYSGTAVEIEDTNEAYQMIGAFGGAQIGNLTITDANNSGEFNSARVANTFNSSLLGGITQELTLINNLTFDDSITVIGDDAIYGAEVNNLTLPAHVTSIGNEAFYSYNGASPLYIPASIRNIGQSAFYTYNKIINVGALQGDVTEGNSWHSNQATVNWGVSP